MSKRFKAPRHFEADPAESEHIPAFLPKDTTFCKGIKTLGGPRRRHAPTLSAPTIPRDCASIMATPRSATSLVSTSGVLVTRMPRSRHAS
jgi:hypothetical protein